MMIVLYRRDASASNCCICGKPSSSAGFGGSGPAAKTSSPLTPHGCRTSLNCASPIRTVVRPTPPSTFRYLATFGRRRSASISSTRSPPAASVEAVLIAVVVLPSPGIEDVTTIERLPWSSPRNCRLVRRLR